MKNGKTARESFLPFSFFLILNFAFFILNLLSDY